MFIKHLLYEYRKIQTKKYWRTMNRDNSTSIGFMSNSAVINFIKNGGVTVGKNTYGKLNINYTGNKDEKLIIGANCSIAGSSNFLLGGEHDYSCITTYPYAYRIFHKENDVKTKGPIIVDDEVWIGDAAWIMSGVHIGKGAIVATGAVVTKDVPPYAMVGGCPAKIIRYRFSENVISKLMDVDLANMELSEKSLEVLTQHVTDDNIDEILDQLRNFYE